MQPRERRRVSGGVMALVVVIGLCLAGAAVAAPPSRSLARDPLPSWADGPLKQRILDFVDSVTRAGSEHRVPVAERVAVFDNDGTLWAEQPMYPQLVFALERVRALAPRHPEWRVTQPFKDILEGGQKALEALGAHGLKPPLLATQTGMTTVEYDRLVADWVATARHPRFNRPYTELVYQPMLELLVLLRRHGFASYIVSGGWTDFMRVWTERVYRIPPERIIGSSMVLRFELRDGIPVLVSLPEMAFFDDRGDKPVGIHKVIGRRPILAFGNSDGDLPMLQWTAAGDGPRLMGLVHHTDAEREWAYDRASSVGRLDRALDEAQTRGWAVVDMRRDWTRVFPWEKEEE